MARAMPRRRGSAELSAQLLEDDRMTAGPAKDQGLADRVRVLSGHVRRLVQARRAQDANPDDPYLGLYVSDGEADVLAAEDGERMEQARWASMQSLDVPSAGTRMGDLAGAFGLDAFDLDLLTIVMAPDLEPRFERLYGYLHDDLTRRRASVGLALELTGRGFADAAARSRFGPEGPLVRHGLVQLEELGRSFLGRGLRSPDRVLAHLIGDDRMEPAIERLRIAPVVIDTPEAARFAKAIGNGVTPIYLQDSAAGIGGSIGASALAACGLESISIDLAGVRSDDDALPLVKAAVREARLRLGGLVVTVTEEILDNHPEVMTVLAEADWPTVIVGPHPWDPAWSRRPVLAEAAERSDSPTVAAIWTSYLPEIEAAALDDATCQLRMRPDQIVRAAELAHRHAAGAGRPVELGDVAAAARAQNSSRLERLARRVRPAVVWSDLVLPDDVSELLFEIESRYRRRDLVHGAWGMGGKNNRRLGVVSLFAGPSGVGKTMAAEALAGALGLDLYQVNLATVVDKYIGETEKNLERIFAAAEGVNGVILFDEADALFGKRSEVSDARDRYANVEVAYLLQRLETYEGVAVLATNLRTNIDDAFTRRLDVLVDFPEPEHEHRLVLWERCLGRALPRSEDVDLDFLATRFRLSGGNIRNIAVSAAFLAAAEDRCVGMADLIRSTAQEYRKLGRLCTVSEFGHWHEMITSG